MADAKTVSQCLARLERLKQTAALRALDQEEEDERDFIRAYLKEVTFQGRRRAFPSPAKEAWKSLLENLRYTFQLLEGEDPELSRWLENHIQTSPVFRWV